MSTSASSSSLSVRLLEVANDFEARRQIEVQQYKAELNKLQLDNIKLKNEVEAQRYRIDDLVEHSQNLAATLAEQSRQQNTDQEALVRELVAAQFELRALHDLRRAAALRAARRKQRDAGGADLGTSTAADEGDENSDPNNHALDGGATKPATKAAGVAGGDDVDSIIANESPYPSKKDLYAAAAAGDADMVRHILQPKFTLSVAPLPLASDSEGEAAVASSFFSDVLGCALVRACEFGRGDVSLALLELGANVHAVDPADASKQGALHKAASCGSTDLLKVLLAKHPAGIDEVDQGPTGDSLLHASARGNHAECVEMLMLAGCDMALRNKEGQTAQEILTAHAVAQAAATASEEEDDDGETDAATGTENDNDAQKEGGDTGGGGINEAAAVTTTDEPQVKTKTQRKTKKKKKKKLLKPIDIPRSLTLLRDTQLQFWNSCAFGNRKYQQSNFARAFEVFTRAIDLSENGDGTDLQISSKDAATIRYNCARAALHMETYLVAVEYCDKSTEFLADFLKAWKLRGECYMHLCDYANAISSFKSALAIAPGDAKAQQHLARAEQMHKQSHYNVLQVGVGATEKEIKKAYRKMCLLWHPDKHSQSKDGQHRASCVFKTIQTAYEELSDPLKRIMYDMELRRQGRYESPPTAAREHQVPERGGAKVTESKTAGTRSRARPTATDQYGRDPAATAADSQRRKHQHPFHPTTQQFAPASTTQQQQQQHAQPARRQQQHHNHHRHDHDGGDDAYYSRRRESEAAEWGGGDYDDDDDDDLSFDGATRHHHREGELDDDDLDSIDEWAHPEVDPVYQQFEDEFAAYSRQRANDRQPSQRSGGGSGSGGRDTRRHGGSSSRLDYDDDDDPEEDEWTQRQRRGTTTTRLPQSNDAADPHAQFDVHDFSFDYQQYAH